ncbi:hypothetical protein BJ138DRAFT_1106524 [Hygrophoropsis aurantiaca]|uniref:Uncharacterized protein n=1 Tax=Hygrophoropsis aurantiaca TaxID=72124 RepID=A0ACB7ZVR1_9AGAM|nr:hypothetical protein BJ138DRAFT_1106524 [Hygrophoropsis aurantiaca]
MSRSTRSASKATSKAVTPRQGSAGSRGMTTSANVRASGSQDDAAREAELMRELQAVQEARKKREEEEKAEQERKELEEYKARRAQEERERRSQAEKVRKQQEASVSRAAPSAVAGLSGDSGRIYKVNDPACERCMDREEVCRHDVTNPKARIKACEGCRSSKSPCSLAKSGVKRERAATGGSGTVATVRKRVKKSTGDVGIPWDRFEGLLERIAEALEGLHESISVALTAPQMEAEVEGKGKGKADEVDVKSASMQGSRSEGGVVRGGCREGGGCGGRAGGK